MNHIGTLLYPKLTMPRIKRVFNSLVIKPFLQLYCEVMTNFHDVDNYRTRGTNITFIYTVRYFSYIGTCTISFINKTTLVI